MDSAKPNYTQKVTIGRHVVQTDEPSEYGGSDQRPTSVELVMAALGTCAATTAQTYAERRQWPLESVHVEPFYARVPADLYGQSDTNISG